MRCEGAGDELDDGIGGVDKLHCGVASINAFEKAVFKGVGGQDYFKQLEKVQAVTLR